MSSEGKDLAVVGLTKSYTQRGMRVPVLESIGFRAAPGEFVSIVGPSGCGKSTVLRILGGLVTPDEGEVRLGGESLRGPGRGRGFVFQDPRLLPWLDVERNVGFGLPPKDAQTAKRVERQLELVGLKGFERAYPHELSGGMAQRVALARALVAETQLLLLDEPFSALDALTRNQMHSELQRVRSLVPVTTVLVTHDIHEAVKLSDRVLVLSPRPAQIVSELTIPSTFAYAEEERLTLHRKLLGELETADASPTTAT